MRGYFMSKMALDPNEDVPISVGEKIKNKAKEVGDKAKGFFKGMGDSMSNAAQVTGKHIADNKYAYSGGAIGAASGIPVGLALGSIADMTATEKVLTTLLSSGVLAGTGAYIGHKYDIPKKASYKYAADKTNTDEKKGQAAWDKVKGGAKAVGDHLNRNKGKYIGGAVGAAAGVPVGAAIAESAGMSPSDKLVTIIATSLATTGAGVTVGHYMDTKK